ncbi:Ribosomal RNA adenine dimethylase domain-containing protein 1 [Thoreauomyces humboldtii]|nr:Ribosomal RNA adenine dimethylase domain-containing protein 1 [Thoreauomyces humboldtii]
MSARRPDCAAEPSSVVNFLALHQWYLHGFHLFDFFTTNVWDGVRPHCWADFVDGHDGGDDLVDDLIDVALGAPIPDLWPSSLREFISEARELAMDRSVLSDDVLDISPETGRFDEEACRRSAMPKKKLHEVDRLSRVIHRVAKETSVNSIIDVGAGHGYLTHVVAHQNPSLRMVAVDCDEGRTCGSKDRGTKVRNKVHHSIPKSMLPSPGSASPNPIVYVTALLDPATLPETCGDTGASYTLVGLHSCGDLSGRTMLGTFLTCPRVRAVVVVSCCYHRITLEDEVSGQTAGFPLSKQVQQALAATPTPLIFSHRSLSSASVTFASFKDKAAICTTLKGHYHRALLELVLSRWDRASSLTGTLQLGGLPKTSHGDFPTFCRAACEKQKLCRSPDDWESLDAQIAEVGGLGSVRRVAFLCVMRSLLGPLVETLVLRDRVAYLEEGMEGQEGGKVWLRNLFEHRESPRNTVIVAMKPPIQ